MKGERALGGMQEGSWVKNLLRAYSQRPFMALSQPPTRRAGGYAKKPFSENESMFPGLAFLPSEDIVLCHTLGGLRLCFTITDSLFHQFSKTNSCYFFLRLIEKN